MKKVIALIIVVLLFATCIGISASATTNECYFCGFSPCECYENYKYCNFAPLNFKLTFSDDYTQIYLNDYTYSRIHDWRLTTEPEYKLPNEVSLTKKQETELLKYSIATNSNCKFMWVELYMADGTQISATYSRDDIADEYEKLFHRIDNPEFSIDFIYPEGNTLTTDKYALWGEEQTIKFAYDYDENFSVVSYSEDKSFSIYQGEVVLYKDEFYFVDCIENNFNGTYELPFEKTLKVYKIKDKALLENLNQNLTKYYEDDFGFFLNDNFSKSISDIFIIIIFALLPLAALIVFGITAIRSKGIYRKMSIIISAISLVELIIFTIITLLVT